MESEHRQVRIINEAITQAKSLVDFRHEEPDKAKGENVRGSHDPGGGDQGKLRSNVYVRRIMIPICSMERSLNVMATQRERWKLPTETDVIYVVGRMT